MTKLTQKNVKFDLREKEEAAFQLIKQKLCSAPILSLPKGSENFIVYCDALHKGLGAVIMQNEKVIAYASRQLKINYKDSVYIDYAASAVPEDELASTVPEDESASAVSEDTPEQRASEWTLTTRSHIMFILRSPRAGHSGRKVTDTLLGIDYIYLRSTVTEDPKSRSKRVRRSSPHLDDHADFGFIIWRHPWDPSKTLAMCGHPLFSNETEGEVGVGDFIELKVPHVLVTCRRRQIYDENDDENVPLYYHINKDFSIPFGREEFCLVTGLRQRHRKLILDEEFAQLYDDDVVSLCCLGILQLVILGVESKRVVPDWMLRLANDRVAWDKYPWGSYVWPTLYSQLRNAVVKRWSPLYVDEPTDEDDSKKYSIFGYTWAFKTWILESYRVTAITYFDRYNRYPRVAAWNKKKGRFLGPMVIPFFEGNMLAARLTPDDNEARSDWWISSRAYFDGFIGQVERVPFDLSRQNMYEIPSDIYREFDEQKREIERNKKEVDNMKEEMRKFREEMNVQPVRQENNEPIIADQHYGLSDFTQFQSTQGHVNSSYFNMGTPPNFQTPMQSQPGSSVWQRQMPAQSATQYWQPDTSSQPGSYYSFGRVPFHMGRQNLQTTIETHDDVDGIFYQNIPNRGRREQFPSKYKLTPFMEQPPTTILPKERVNKTKNKGKKANLSPLNLGGAFEDDNVEENNVTFLGSQFTGNFLMYENVDPSKVRRGNYVNLLAFLNDPHQVYLDCYMKGYIVPVSFWQQLVPHFCMPDMHRLPHGTPIGWLSGEVFSL
ncbi:phospholipase-like protein [Tanacetum coccineum]